MPSQSVEAQPAPVAQSPQSVAYTLTTGVEIECCFPRHAAQTYNGQQEALRTVSGRMAAAGLSLSGHDGSTTTSWGVGYDSSCGAELRSPVFSTREQAANDVRIVCDALRDVGFTVDHRCGLHVHLGTGVKADAAVDRFHQFLYRNEGTLMKFVPACRRNHGYCSPIVGDMAASLMQVLYNKNPKMVWGTRPWFHYSGHHTTEVRLQAGSLDSQRILNWFDFLQQLWHAAQASKQYTPDWRIFVRDRYYTTHLRDPFPSKRNRALAFSRITRPGGETQFLAGAREYVSNSDL